MDEDKIQYIVIATTNPEKALFIFSKDAMIFDRIEIQFTEKYAPTVEYLLRILRKAFGWYEDERGYKEVENTKCVFNKFGYCENENISMDKNDLRCKENVRINCKEYKKKFSNTFTVNVVIVNKVGQSKGL